MKTFILGLLLFYGSNSVSQTIENLKILPGLNELAKQTKKIHDANYTMDFDPLADLTYPAIVAQLGGREKFIVHLDSDYQNGEFRKRIQIEHPVFQYSEIKKTEDQNICVITYYNPIRYFIEAPMDATSGPIKAAELQKIEQATQAIYEPKRNTINVKRQTKLVAIADATTNYQWKFIDVSDASQRKIIDLVLNENIKKEFGL